MQKEIVETKEEARTFAESFIKDMKTCGHSYSTTELKNSILVHNEANVVKFIVEFEKV